MRGPDLVWHNYCFICIIGKVGLAKKAEEDPDLVSIGGLEYAGRYRPVGVSPFCWGALALHFKGLLSVKTGSK